MRSRRLSALSALSALASLVVLGPLVACTPAQAPNGDPASRGAPSTVANAASASAAPSADVASSASASAAPFGSGSAVATADANVVVGTLVVAKSEKGRKSLESWLGRFKVVDGDREVRVHASSAVSEEALEKWAGKRVRVRGERIAPSAPDPTEQAPLGPDGKPMMRPGGLRVQSIESAP